VVAQAGIEQVELEGTIGFDRIENVELAGERL
jgi:hypothetical protein